MSTRTVDASIGRTRSTYRWVVLFACWASFTLTSVDRSTWGPASIFVGDSLAVPVASLGAFATAYYIGYVVSNALGGLSSDWFGGRITLSISLFGAGGFMVLFGSTTSASMGIAVQAMVGFFAGADYSAGIRLITSWFKPSELGLAMGIFTTATSLGTAIANGVVPALIARSGWETSYHLFGGISMGAAVLLFLAVRPGPLLDDDKPTTRSRRKPDIGALVRNRDLVFTCLTGFCAFWGLYGFVVWSNALMIKGRGIPPITAGLVVAIFAITAVVAKPVIGFLADRFLGGARKIPIMVILALFGLVLIGFGNLGTAEAFIWAAPLLGATAYGWAPLIVALVPRLVPGAVTGTASGFANATWQLGSVIVPVAVGAVFAATGSFNAAFLTLAAGPLAGVLFMVGVREPRRSNRTLEGKHQNDEQ
jgi:ACS family glucarate transporter-like MFS transporter